MAMPSIPWRWTRVPAMVPRAAAVVAGPPSDYDFREQHMGATVAVVTRRWPQLMDVVDDGAMLVIENQSSDGAGDYRQPELVLLVGTAHVSRTSAQQVRRVIEAVRPDNVVVELCGSRAGIMYFEPAIEEQQQQQSILSLTGTDRTAALLRSFKLGGQSAFFLRLVLAGVSDKISKTAAAPVGEEFRAARKAAKATGAQLVLGDRPIEITLRRAWTALQWNEKLRLLRALWLVVSSSQVDASESTLQRLQADDVISAMFSEMAIRFPTLLQYLVWERDLYLAWSLKRSKAVNGSKIVVGVIGRGHLRGVAYALQNSQEDKLRFKDLVSTGHSTSRVLTNLVLETLAGFGLWWIYANWDSVKLQFEELQKLLEVHSL